MAPEQEERQIYGLKEGVRVFRTGGEVRFRKGVWSFNEAVLKLAGQSDAIVRFFEQLADQFLDDGKCDVAALAAGTGVAGNERTFSLEILDGLVQQQYLYSGEHLDRTRIVSALLGGNLSGFEEYISNPRPVLFFSDSPYAENAAKMMAKETRLPLDVLAPEVLEELAAVDLTSRTDAVAHKEAESRLERHLSGGYTAVLACLASPNLSMLRNLNRLLIRNEMPLIIGLIDGPFITVLSTLVPKTGCFECYEQRMMARLEDTLAYREFVQNTKGASSLEAGSWFSPPLHMLAAFVLSEGYLYSTLSTLRIGGRIVSAYLPLLEIQVQDLLRVPYCPGCGFVSKGQMNEMYTSSRRLINEMMDAVEVEAED